MYQLILILHVLVAMVLIVLVLIQHGKGADIGASFGSGASNTVFGSQGTGSFLFKLTGGLALTFFATSLLLSSMVSMQYRQSQSVELPQSVPMPKTQVPIPAVPSKTNTDQKG
jgi:preprotein translocase subunit SecG